MVQNRDWIALAVGNSRLHWAWFEHHTLIETWDTSHLDDSVQPNQLPEKFLCCKLTDQSSICLPVYLASVVPAQTRLWRSYRQLNIISLQDIKLTNTYSTMGIDRALTVWGAVATYQQACLIIDGGTALTFTGVNQQARLIGGAILPGLRLQLVSLNQKTAALPQVQLTNSSLPRWALDTNQAIASGIIYTAIAGIGSFIIDWQQQFPDSLVIFTGGDAQLLSRYLHLQCPDLKQNTIIDQNLVFKGINLVYKQREQY
ncbi:MAG: pantothenate kinase [Cyanobacteria bacterium P01_A01_bin.83]